MCGVAGYYGAFPLKAQRVQECLKLMHRRGPDHSDFFQHTNAEGRHVYLLSSRLSILDLEERSNQPFRLGSKVLIYNGELYNYLELKRKLTAQNKQFFTHSDTEVLLRVLLDFGWEGLDHCEGMWAFALYDEVDGSLILSRDRFGEKPLYIYHDQTGLYFGSEVKFVFCLLGRRLDVNYDHLYRYMINGYKSLYKGNEAFFHGLEELPRASVFQVDSFGGITKANYWNPSITQNQTLTYQDVLEGARETLIQSVRLRLRSDVPLAFCMSGGIDSNALIHIAKKELDYDVHAFTVMSTDNRYEEQDMIHCSISDLSVPHISVPVDHQEFLPKLRTLIIQHDVPVYTITYYAHWLLMSSISEHGYRVSISGTGADELFSGYYDHHLAFLFDIQNNSSLYRDYLLDWDYHVKPLVRNPYLRDPELFVQNADFRDHIYLNSDEFAQHFYNNWKEPFTETKYVEDLLRNRMLNELFHEAIPVILHEADLNAMYFSIENRSPFLDRALFEFCNQIPTKFLMRNGFQKAVLRDSMRGIVPSAILDNRRKVGFNVSILSFLNVHDPDIKSYLLDKSAIFDHVRRDKIEALIQKPELLNSESKFLFSFLCSKMFLEEFAH